MLDPSRGGDSWQARPGGKRIIAEQPGLHGPVKGEYVSGRQEGALRWVALVILLAGGFLPPLDFFIVNVALSSIHESLDATPAELQLVISGYACGYGVFLITGGRLGDLYGRKRCFLIGMAGFSVGHLG